MSELKPCPFCGSTDVANVSGNYAGPSNRLHAGDEIFAVNCKECGASVPNRYRNELVVKAWNRRTQPVQDRSDLWREGYERGMAEGAAYKEAYIKLLEQIANLQAMRPPAPMILRAQLAHVPRLTDDELFDLWNTADVPGESIFPEFRDTFRAIEAVLIAKIERNKP